VPASTEGAPAAGEFEEASIEGRAHLDERFQPAEESTAVGDSEGGDLSTPGHGVRGAAAFFGG